MPEDKPRSRAGRLVRSQGHKASGGHSLHINRAKREPNALPPIERHHHHKERSLAYEHKEYPKWLHFDGKSVLVHSLEEEGALGPKRGHGKPKSDAPHSEGEISRKELVALAKAKGVTKANFRKTEELLSLVG